MEKIIPPPLADDAVVLEQKISEYAMAFDLLSVISQAHTEQEVVQNIIQMFEILFAPQRVFYLSVEDGHPGAVYSSLPLPEDTAFIQKRLFSLEQKYTWTDSGNGFRVAIRYNGSHVGILEVDDLLFPENKERYLNLTFSIMSICGLAMENAKQYQELHEIGNQLRIEKQKLEIALFDVKKLSGLLPICSHCKKIRDDDGYWQEVDAYIRKHSDLRFSHSICRDCAKTHYPDYDIYDN